MTLLVTGFDPFGGLETNPAAVAGAWLAQERPDTVFAQLPTSYSRSRDALEAAVVEHVPAALLLLGYAAGASGLRIERQARNAVTAPAADNDGVRLAGPITPGAPETLASTGGPRAVLHQLAEAAVETTDSDDAGGYVCNWLYWHALSGFGDRPVLFVHLSAFSPASANARGLRAVADLLTRDP